MRGCANRHPLGYTRPGLTGSVAYASMAAKQQLFTVRKHSRAYCPKTWGCLAHFAMGTGT